MEKFKNKFRVNTARLPNWDYGRNGCYFITINTFKGNHYFGEISNGEMHLSDIGQIANAIWLKIPDQFPYSKLHNHIIMPNHMHGIIQISKNTAPNPAPNLVQTRFIASPDPESARKSPKEEKRFIASPDPESARESPKEEKRFIASPDLAPDPTPDPVKTRFIASPSGGGASGRHNPMLQQNLPRILRWYKGRCTFEIRKQHPYFKWHIRYHDHIIRDEKAFYNIQKYIANNPLKWWEEKIRIR